MLIALKLNFKVIRKNNILKFNLKKWQVHLIDQSDCDSGFIPLTSSPCPAFLTGFSIDTD